MSTMYILQSQGYLLLYNPENVATRFKMIYYEVYKIYASLVIVTDVYLTLLQDLCSITVFAVHFN